MSRPRKGEEGCEQATSKWRQTMLDKYGAEGLHEKMREIGRLGGTNGRGPNYRGGFASDRVGADGLTGRERSHIAGKKGGTISRRTGVKNHQGTGYHRPDDIDRAEQELEQADGRDR